MRIRDRKNCVHVPRALGKAAQPTKHAGLRCALAPGALLLIGVLLPVPLPAMSYFPTVTGEQFVRDMLAASDSDQAAFKRERMIGYTDGVLDGTVGVRWCPAGREVAHEMSFVAAEELKHLPAKQLKGGAAPLILAVLGKLYPCTGSGAKS